MNIRVLYFEGCPNHEATAALVRRIARENDMGDDIDPSARDRTDFGMACRLYGARGVPPAAMIAAAIRRARA